MNSIFIKALGYQNITKKEKIQKQTKIDFNISKGIKIYKQEIAKEPYQPLSNLIQKLQLCALKSSNGNTVTTTQQ